MCNAIHVFSSHCLLARHSIPDRRLMAARLIWFLRTVVPAAASFIPIRSLKKQNALGLASKARWSHLIFGYPKLVMEDVVKHLLRVAVLNRHGRKWIDLAAAQERSCVPPEAFRAVALA